MRIASYGSLIKLSKDRIRKRMTSKDEEKMKVLSEKLIK